MTGTLNICGLSRTTYWHGMKGGMDVHGKLLSEGLASRGHKVSILSTAHPERRQHDEINNVCIHYLKGTVYGGRRQGWIEKSSAMFNMLRRIHRFNIVWSQSFDAFGLVRSRCIPDGIPLVVTLHGSIQQEMKTFSINLAAKLKDPRRIIKPFLGLLYSYAIAQKPVLQSANRVITVGPQVVDDLGRWYGRSIKKKCVVVPNGVDTNRFRPRFELRKRVRAHFGINERDTVLVTLGRLTAEKGNHIVIEAMHRLKNSHPRTKLLIVGHGPDRERLESLVDHYELTDRVIFAGEVDNEETVQFYNAADIFIMPTLTVEGLPFVLLEAMSCAKPLIASRAGGNVSLVVHDQNGKLFEPGDASELTQMIRQLIVDRRMQRQLSRAARETAQNEHNVNTMIDTVDRIMRAAVYDSPGGVRK